MHQVHPSWEPDVDGPARYRADERPAPPHRPWLLLNMVASVDGAITLDGVSGGLSGPADKAVFFTLRALADVILVGAGTARAEDYGPPRTSPSDQEWRVGRGQAPFPTIAVASGRLELSPDGRLFTGSPTRPVVLTHGRSDPARRRALAPVADVVVAGEDALDPRAALGALRARGAAVVLCEGGPTLNGTLLGAGVVDELCVTVSPLLTGGPDARLVRGETLDPPVELELARQLVDGDVVLSRYLVRR